MAQSFQQMSQIIFSNLEQLRSGLNFSHKAWADLHELTPAEYERYYLRGCGELPVTAVQRICEHFNLSLESLFKQDGIDVYAVSRHYYHGDFAYIPGKYSVGAFSKRMSMRNVIEHLTKSFGSAEAFRILRALQVHPAAFADGNQPINIKFAIDMMDKISVDDNSYFQSLGAYAVTKTARHPFAEPLKKTRSISELYLCYLEDVVRAIDKNYNYRFISVGPTEFIVEALQSDEVIDALKTKTYNSPRICHYKTGLIGSIPHYVNTPALPVKKIRCIHSGHSSCQWLVSFEGRELLKQSS